MSDSGAFVDQTNGTHAQAKQTKTTRGYIKQGVWYPHNMRATETATRDPLSPVHCNRVNPRSFPKAEPIGNPPGLSTPNKSFTHNPRIYESPPGLKNPNIPDTPSDHEDVADQFPWHSNRYAPDAGSKHKSWRSNRNCSRSPSPTEHGSWRSTTNLFAKNSLDDTFGEEPLYKSLKVRLNRVAKVKSQSCPSSRCTTPKDQLAFSAPNTPLCQPPSNAQSRLSSTSVSDTHSKASSANASSPLSNSSNTGPNTKTNSNTNNNTEVQAPVNGALAALAAAQKALGRVKSAQATASKSSSSCSAPLPVDGVDGSADVEVVPCVVKAALSSNLLKKQWAPNPPTEFDDKVSEAKKLISKALCSQLVKESTYDRWANTGPGYDSSEYWHLLKDEEGNWKELTVELLLQVPQPPPPARCRPVVRPVADPVELAHMVHNTLHQKTVYDQMPLSLAAHLRSKSVDDLSSMADEFDGCHPEDRATASSPVTRLNSPTSTPRARDDTHSDESTPTATPTIAPPPVTTPAPLVAHAINITPSTNTSLSVASVQSTPAVNPASLDTEEVTSEVASLSSVVSNESTPVMKLATLDSEEVCSEQVSLSSVVSLESTPATKPATLAAEEFSHSSALPADEDTTAESDASDSSSPSSLSSLPSSITCSETETSSSDPLEKYYDRCLSDSMKSTDTSVVAEKPFSSLRRYSTEDEDEEDFLTFSCPSIVMAELMLGSSRLVSV